MTKQEAREKFIDRLTKTWAQEFTCGKLLIPGRKFKFMNANGIYDIEIVSYDDEKVMVSFVVLETNQQCCWTLDNFYIFDHEYFKQLYSAATDYGLFSDNRWQGDNYIMDKGIYILHNNNIDKDKGFYVGQASGKSGKFSGRLYDHIHNSSKQKIDLAIKNNEPFSLKVILLKNTDFDNVNALEATAIAYFESYVKYGNEGYNVKRGTNVAGNKAITKKL